MSQQEDAVPGFTLPMFLQTEFFRLASSLNLDADRLDTEEECMDLMDNAVRAIERLRYEQQQAASQTSKPITAKPKSDSAQASRARNLEEDLRLSLKSVEDLDSLRKRNAHLSSKCRKEKMHREALEKFVESQNKKIGILVEHVEKLMKAIKIESGKSMKALDANRKCNQEKKALEKKIEKLNKVIATQNRYIIEIAEGSKVLEDQLQLMDEKFLDMRSKMDMARKQFATEVDKTKKKMKDLRLKYSVATGGGLLDSVNPARYETTMGGNNMSPNGRTRPQSAFGAFTDNTMPGSNKSKRPNSAGFTRDYNPAMPNTASHSGNVAANAFAGAMMQMERDHWLSGNPDNNNAQQPGGMIRRATISPISRSSSAVINRPSSASSSSRKNVGFNHNGSSGKSSSGGGKAAVSRVQSKKDLNLNKVLDKIDRKQQTGTSQTGTSQTGTGGAVRWTDEQLQNLINN